MPPFRARTEPEAGDPVSSRPTDASAETRAAELIEQAEAAARIEDRIARLFQAALIFEIQLGDAEKAELIAQTALASDRGERCLRAMEAAIAATRELGASGGAAALAHLGRLCFEATAQAAALVAFRRSVELAPTNRECRELLVDALERSGEHANLLHHLRAVSAMITDERERRPLLVKLARAARDHGNDPVTTVEAFEQALAAGSADVDLQHEFLDVLVAARSWRRAVQVLKDLAAAETGKTRAKFLVAAANILAAELDDADEAVELWNQALDEDPADHKSFERIDKVLTARRAFREEARNYRRMIKRVGPEPHDGNRGTLLALWRGLAEIHRTRLDDPAGAITAFEVCEGLAPQDPSFGTAIAELHEMAGDLASASTKRQALLSRAADPDAVAAELRVLCRLWRKQGRRDAAYVAASALAAGGRADVDEKALVERHALRGLPSHAAAFDEEIWRALAGPEQERRLSQIFGLVGPALALGRAREPRVAGVDERQRLDVPGRPQPVVGLVRHLCQLLAVPAPICFGRPDGGTRVDLLPLLIEGRFAPGLVIGAGAAAQGEVELACTLVRRLAQLRPEHFVLWPDVIASTGDLRAVFLAALRLFQPNLPLPDPDAASAARFGAVIHRTLAPGAVDALRSLVPSLLAEGARLDVSLWALAAERACERAALLVAGDVGAAVRSMLAEPARRGRGGEAVVDLVRWSASEAHLETRARLGIAVTARARG